jgi:hypothetical protein
MKAALREILQQKIDGKPHSGRLGFDESCEHCHIVISFVDEYNVWPERPSRRNLKR